MTAALAIGVALAALAFLAVVMPGSTTSNQGE